MSYEEKYNEILEWARKNKARLNGVPIEEVLPELAESEDERMLQEIKRYIKEQGDKPNGLPNGTVAVYDMIDWLEKQKEPKWSPSEGEMGVLYKLCYLSNQITDEDDTELTRLYQDLKREYFNGHSFENMFLNEKQKEQKPAEWSEEDEACIRNLESIIYYDKKLPNDTRVILGKFLSNLRSKSHWKPSEEQMEVLKDYADSAIDSQRDIEGNILFSLYDDLEKLTESNFDPKVPSIKEAVIKIVKSISPKVLEYEGFSREQVVKWLYDKEE